MIGWVWVTLGAAGEERCREGEQHLITTPENSAAPTTLPLLPNLSFSLPSWVSLSHGAALPHLEVPFYGVVGHRGGGGNLPRTQCQ